MMLANMIGKAIAKKGIYLLADVVIPGSGTALKGANLLMSCGLKGDRAVEAVSKLGFDNSIELCEDVGEIQETITDAVVDFFQDLF